MSPSVHIQCTIAAITNFIFDNYPSKCEYVKDACSEDSSIIDFFKLYYCTLGEDNIVFLLLSVVFVLIAFYCISATAEDYLEPALSTIADKFNFSESLAGVTLVSLANGAPDVFAAFAAGSLQDEGILVPLGGLFGGGLFTTSIVLAACILSSKTFSVQADSWSLNRDCLSYLCSALYLLALGVYGEINFINVLGFFVIYGIFIAIAIYNEFLIKNEEKQKLSYENYYPESEVSVLVNYDEENERDIEGIQDLVRHEYIPDYKKLAAQQNDQISETKTQSPKRNSPNQKKKEGIRKYGSHSSLSKLQWQYYTMKKKLRTEFSEVREKGILGKFFSMVGIVHKIIGDLTIPACTQSKWNKSKAMIQPFTVSIFLLWQFGLIEKLYDPVNLLIYLTLISAASVHIWKTTRPSTIPGGLLNYFLLIFSFISAAAWLNIIAHTIINFINLLSIFTGLPMNYLGLTLLAWGNSLPDLYVDIALIKKGLGQTALSGIFGGQFFNFVIGFGISLLRQLWTFGPRKFGLLEGSQVAIINLILIWWLVLNLAGTVVYGNKNHYKFYRNFAAYLIAFYILFLVFVTLVSL